MVQIYWSIQHHHRAVPADSLMTPTAPVVVTRSEATAIALATAADFAATATTLAVVVLTGHFARAASVLAIHTAVSFCNEINTVCRSMYDTIIFN